MFFDGYMITNHHVRESCQDVVLLTRENLQGSSTVVTLIQALELYLSVKGLGRADMFIRTARRNIDYVIDCLADTRLDMYKLKASDFYLLEISSASLLEAESLM